MMTVWVTDSWLIDFRPAIRNKKGTDRYHNYRLPKYGKQ